jgi:hypothetical protein
MSAKKVNYQIVPLDHEAYSSLQHAREFHPALAPARIALAWRLRTKADKDNLLTLGKCVKVSDLQKEFAYWDFLLVLNQEFFLQFDEKQRLALIDHELCHARPLLDDKGLQSKDERGRLLWRLRKHDLEEFREVIDRHGCYKDDLELFARAILKRNPTRSLEFPIEAQSARIELAQ